MKKIMMVLALVAGFSAVGSTDVYQFSSNLKFPAVGKTAFVGASTSMSGTLTIADDENGSNTTAVLKVTLKKTKATYTLVPDDASAIAIFGKKGTDCAQMIKFVNEDQSEGLIELTFYGWGTLKTKTTGGCTPCGDTTSTCSRITRLQGVVGGKYICPCGGSFQAWDGSCYIDPEEEVQDMTVYGTTAKFTLKTVDGKKWK